MRGEPAVEDVVELRGPAAGDGEPARPHRRRDVGVGDRGTDHGFGLLHDLRRRPVVDAEPGDPGPGDPGAREPVLPGLREALPCLRAVADDREAARRTPREEQLPLGVRELLCLVDDDVREGPREPVGVGPGRAVGGAERVAQVGTAQHAHDLHLGAVGLDQVRHDVVHPGRCSVGLGALAAPSTRRGGVAQPLPGRVEEGQVGRGPRLRLAALQRPDLVRRQPRRAQPQERGHGPQVADDVRRVEQRPRLTERVPELGVPLERATHLFARRLVVVLVDEDRDERVPDLVAAVVVRRAGLGRGEGVRPVVGREAHVGPRRRHGAPARRRLLVEPDPGLDGPHQVGRRLEPRHVGVGLDAGARTLGHEVAQGRELHAVLPEARQDVRHVVEVRLVRPDDEHPTAPRVHQRLRVQEVGGAVQRDHRLPGAGSAVDDERAASPGPDDGVLVGGERPEHVAHTRRPRAAEARDEGGPVVERGGAQRAGDAVEAVRREDLVPVVGDLSGGPAVPAPARETHRVGERRAEERLGRGGTPVHEEPAAVVVGQPEPPDVHGLRVACEDHPAEAQVDAEPA